MNYPVLNTTTQVAQTYQYGRTVAPSSLDAVRSDDGANRRSVSDGGRR